MSVDIRPLLADYYAADDALAAGIAAEASNVEELRDVRELARNAVVSARREHSKGFMPEPFSVAGIERLLDDPLAQKYWRNRVLAPESEYQLERLFNEEG